MAEMVERQVPGIHHRKVGDIVVTTLLDGYIDVVPESFHNVTPDQVATLLSEGFRPPKPRVTVNAYLVRSGGRTALIETGSSATLGPTLGWLRENISKAGVSIGDIDTVLLTHMHPDHSNGLTDESGKLVFTRAEILMHENERAHWSNDERLAASKDRQRYYFETARARLAACGERLRTFTSGEVFPGVTAEPIPGHTPGHTAYRIASGNESLLVWGDIVHMPEIQIPHPEASTTMDTDPAGAIATRKRVLDMVASDRQLVAGMHIGFPGLAHIVRRGASYAFVPEPWSLVP
jgi:glyoxylase-like metal-dependent hydrolase (beta-lactamase superfamily II)